MNPQVQIDHTRLLAALATLPRERSRALATLPDVLTSHGEGHATVTIRHADGSLELAASNDPTFPPGSDFPKDGVVARAASSGESIYIRDTREDPLYRPVEGRCYRVELAIPIFERDSVVAVLNVEREAEYQDADRRVIELFASGVSQQLTQASQSVEGRLSSALAAEIAGVANMEAATLLALHILSPAVGAAASVIVTEKSGKLVPVATYGDGRIWEDLGAGTPYPHGFAWQACLSGEPRFTRDYANDPRSLDELRHSVPPTALTLPIGLHHTHRSALSLHFHAGAHVSSADVQLLQGVCRQLAASLSAAHASSMQNRLIELHTRALHQEMPDLYQEILDAAIEHVPGAEAGSLLVRRDADDTFKYVAATGFDLAGLQKIEFPEAHMLAWYAGSEADWDSGTVRVLHKSKQDLAKHSREAIGNDGLGYIGGLDRLKGTACMPVKYEGQVLAVLNLDNFTRTTAFGDDSLHSLGLFRLPLATLLAGVQHREELALASRTDPLTGLHNRAGFTYHLQRQHARSHRSGEPFTLLVMDLSGFKRINDTLGHPTGDEALRMVTRALLSVTRPGDTLGRWGGDEFVALLPGADEAAARAVAERFQRVVSGIEIEGLRLGVDVGAATYRRDGRTIDELIKAADDRMYEMKKFRAGPAADIHHQRPEASSEERELLRPPRAEATH